MVRTLNLCGLRRIRSCGTYTQFVWCFQFPGELGPALYTLHHTCTSSTYTYFLSGFQDPETLMTPGSFQFWVRGSKFGVWGSGSGKFWKLWSRCALEHETWKLLRNVRHEINFETVGTWKESMQWKTKCRARNIFKSIYRHYCSGMKELKWKDNVCMKCEWLNCFLNCQSVNCFTQNRIL